LPAEVTVSLTTTSRRISQTHEVIESLLLQRVRPTRIVLWLSREPHLMDQGVAEEAVPAALRDLVGERFVLRWTPNIGPYRKLLPAMQAFEGLIATVDDDTLYPPTWLEGLLSLHRRYPRAVCCYRAHRMLLAGDGNLASYWRWPAFDGDEPALNCFPTGKDGVLYPPGSLHGDVLDVQRLLCLAPASDDIWFKIMALRCGTSAIGMRGHDSLPVVCLPDQLQGLYARYNLMGNDETLANVMSAFGVSPALIDAGV
jgi:hypothetical protein